jgi:hypothetical protein
MLQHADSYNSLVSVFSTIPDAVIRTPTQPVESYVYEAETLFKAALSDRAELEATGLDWAVVESLSRRAGALREAESEWLGRGFGSPQAQRRWKEAEAQGQLIRDDLLAGYRFAYRNHPELLSRVAAIGEGATQVDLVQDLNDQAVLGRHNLAPLEAIGITAAQVEAAATKSAELADLLSTRDGVNTSDPAKKLRDQAFTYLETAVDEIRAYGRYISRRKPDRLKRYTKQYTARRRSPQTQDAEPAPAA